MNPKIMDVYFFLKLIISFIIGGSAIAFIGWMAENANKKLAGIVISLPSTVVISYIFIAWTLSPKVIASAVPATIWSAGAVQIFAIIYYYISNIKIKNNWFSMGLSILGALIGWFIWALPFAFLKISNIYVALGGYILTVLISYYFLTIKNNTEDSFRSLRYSIWQKFGRALFAGLIIASAVFLAKVVNPFWGGLFSSFPAVFTSTFLIFHYYHGHKMIAKVTKAIPAGSIVYVMFALAATYTYPNFGIILGTFLAYLASLVLFLFLFKRSDKKS